jgi:hypothetical protein
LIKQLVGKPVGEVMPVSLKRTRNIRRARISVLLIILSLVIAGAASAQADFIVGFPAEPGWANENASTLDVTAPYLSVTYDGAGHFSASSAYDGFNMLNNDSDPSYDIGGASHLQIDLTLNPSTGAPISGTFNLSGDASSSYVAVSSGTLLSGTISAFGFPNAAQAAADAGAENFQFLFDTTGGDLAPWYASIAVNLTLADVNFNGTFGANAFANFQGDDFTGAQADIFAGPPSPVPEPTSLSLLCFGTVVLTTGYGVLRGARKLRGSPLG